MIQTLARAPVSLYEANPALSRTPRYNYYTDPMGPLLPGSTCYTATTFAS